MRLGYSLLSYRSGVLDTLCAHAVHTMFKVDANKITVRLSRVRTKGARLFYVEQPYGYMRYRRPHQRESQGILYSAFADHIQQLFNAGDLDVEQPLFVTITARRK